MDVFETLNQTRYNVGLCQIARISTGNNKENLFTGKLSQSCWARCIPSVKMDSKFYVILETGRPCASLKRRDGMLEGGQRQISDTTDTLSTMVSNPWQIIEHVYCLIRNIS
jgi:hypothetical protein